MKRTACRFGVAAALLAALTLTASVGSALAGDHKGGNRGDGTRWAGPSVNWGHKGWQKPTGSTPGPTTLAGPATRAAAQAATPPLGTQKIWMTLNDVSGQYFFTTFTLRGVGNNIEVWVQNNINFPTGDCRNGARTTVTDDQVDYFINEFDSNIYPTESASFSTPPDRDGSDAQIPELLGQPNALGITPEYYQGAGGNIVTLVANVRDSNYFDTNNAHANSFIAGFFSSQLNDFFGRNVMTIDAFDWLHRTGANPPNEPVPGDLCNSAPARPHSYEGVFAHEYQHLLESYASPGELSWINEGLSDYAISLVGYGAPEKTIDDVGFESHVQCFYGFLNTQTASNPNPTRAGGPENSLTLWGDQGDDEILCDYGAAWTFMLWLHSHYGDAFMSALHTQPLNGMAGLQATLDQFLTGKKALDVIHAWAASIAVDAALDQSNPFARALGKSFQVTSLHAAVNWSNPEAYSDAGAPPNGSDYVRLRDGSGNPITAGTIKSLSFDGAKTLAPDPVGWTIDDGALFSGAGDEIDRSIIREVTVPSASPTLTFSAKYNMEDLWDFGFVQVSTDHGATFTSLACSNTTSDHDPSAYPTVVSNVPGYTGTQDEYRAETCDLSAYAGQTIAISFRAITDWASNGNADSTLQPGWWVKDIAVGGSAVGGSSLDGWQSLTEYNPYPVAWTVQLVGIDSANTVPPIVVKLPLDKNGHLSVSLGKLSSLLGALLGNKVDTVGAIVTFDDVNEGARTYATYALTVNGVVQPGGGA